MGNKRGEYVTDVRAVLAVTEPQLPAREAGSKLYYGWVVAGAAFVAMVIAYGSSIYGFGVFFKPLLADFGWGRGTTSVAFSIYMLAYGASSIFMGMLTDRHGPRVTVALGGFLMGLGLVLSHWVNALWHLYFSYGFLAGTATGAFYVPLSVTMARLFDRKRGLALGILMAGAGSGGVIMPPIIERLIASYDWRIAFLVTGIICWAIILPASLLMKQPSRNVVSSGISRLIGQRSLRRVLATRAFVTLVVMYFMWGIAYAIVLVHLVAYATDFGMSSAAAASLISVLGLASVFGRLIMGGISDRIDTRKLFVVCFCFLTLSVLWLMSISSSWMFYVFAAVFGFFYGGNTPLWPATVSRYFGLESMGAVFGILLLGATTGSALGSPLGGFVFDVTKSYYIALLISAIGLMLALLLGLSLRVPAGRRTQQEPNAGL